MNTITKEQAVQLAIEAGFAEITSDRLKVVVCRLANDARNQALEERDQLRAELVAIRAQKSVAETTCDCYPDHGGTIYAEAVLPRGTPLYASPKDKDAGLVAEIDSLQRTLRQEALARENVTAMRDQLRAQVAELEKDAATLVNAIKLDRHDWEDWPEDSRNAFSAIARKATP